MVGTELLRGAELLEILLCQEATCASLILALLRLIDYLLSYHHAHTDNPRKHGAWDTGLHDVGLQRSEHLEAYATCDTWL